MQERYVKPFCFTIATPTKRFVLQAADEREMEAWLEAVATNLEVCSYVSVSSLVEELARDYAEQLEGEDER